MKHANELGVGTNHPVCMGLAQQHLRNKNVEGSWVSRQGKSRPSLWSQLTAEVANSLLLLLTRGTFSCWLSLSNAFTYRLQRPKG